MGTLLIDKKEVLNRWKKYSEELHNGGAFSDQIVSTDSVKMEKSITCAEFEKARQQFKVIRSRGPDGVPAECLKAFNENGKNALKKYVK